MGQSAVKNNIRLAASPKILLGSSKNAEWDTFQRSFEKTRITWMNTFFDDLAIEDGSEDNGVKFILSAVEGTGNRSEFSGR